MALRESYSIGSESLGFVLKRADARSYRRQTVENVDFLVVLDGTHSPDKLAFPCEASDAVFCFSATDRFHPVLELLKGIMQDSPSWKKKTHFVWLLREDEKVAPLVPELSQLTKRDFKLHTSESQALTRLSTQGIDRIVHYLRGVRVGMALSGGAAHGMAHLGVLMALEEEGITIDRIARTSAGVLRRSADSLVPSPPPRAAGIAGERVG